MDAEDDQTVRLRVRRAGLRSFTRLLSFTRRALFDERRDLRGRDVLLRDFSLRRQRLGELFNRSRRPGDLLEGGVLIRGLEFVKLYNVVKLRDRLNPFRLLPRVG